MQRVIRSFDELTNQEQPLAGGKGGTLARLYQDGFPVPDGFVILPQAFAGDELTAEGWTAVQAQLEQLRTVAGNHTSFAVRSSALSEDSAQASFAGEFETVLDVHSDEMIQAAIRTVRQSRHSERVRAYSEAHGIDPVHDMSVVVQRLVRADLSGVLFTADPVNGSQARMIGNFVFGYGEDLVSGEAEPFTFLLERPKGNYEGAKELERFARQLYRLGSRLEEELDGPQDIEWAIDGERLYILQSRPITTLVAWDPVTGEWNDSLVGDYVWSRNNFGEARPDVMSPFTFSISDEVWSEISILPGYSMAGNICGRYYANVSFSVSVLRAMGKSQEAAMEQMAGLLGDVPAELEIPLIPISRWTLLRALPGMIALGWKEKQGAKKIPEFLDRNPQLCHDLRQRIRQVRSKSDLVSIWREEIRPYLTESLWVMGGAAQPLEALMKVKRELIDLVGDADANSLFSGLSGDEHLLASLGPVVGVARVAQGKMSRQEYFDRYGHRGPHEAELSYPRPAEDPDWLERQLAEYEQNPVDVDGLLERRRNEFQAAWERLQTQHPDRAKKLRGKIKEVGPAARMRESVRDEATRFLWVEREWAFRAGELTSLHDDIFLLTISEVLDLLAGDGSAAANIPARRKTYERYRKLPAYPMIIRGRFDAFQWASDPQRRNDIFGAHSATSVSTSDTISGFAGAAGLVEGLVRVLDDPEDGHRLQPGEVLVAVTTNVGWTPLFPRAAAVVTDVGAPLSHAAIVARELGIPAVVGCVDATTRLRTGDRVRVDGGRGLVEIISQGR
ncbi:MAG: PEP/pyruvate-binding domain-containing protein [Anaerolineae bacterium]|jgi:pyruvate,water dikinase